MKPYIAMCSLCLAVGAGLGHGYGKHTTAVNFADACDQGSFVELQIGDVARTIKEEKNVYFLIKKCTNQ